MAPVHPLSFTARLSFTKGPNSDMARDACTSRKQIDLWRQRGEAFERSSRRKQARQEIEPNVVYLLCVKIALLNLFFVKKNGKQDKIKVQR
jgi:hypothetical protein